MDFAKNILPGLGGPTLTPAVKDLKSLIEGSPEFLKLSTEMFTQVRPDILGLANNFISFISSLNNLAQNAPVFSSTSSKHGYAGCPFTELLRPYISTPAGYKLFVNPKVNDTLIKILGEWNIFLSSSKSTDVLTEKPNGWFSPEALSAMPNFEATYVCDRNLPYWEFSSWDNFFTRKLWDGARPIADPHNPNIITSACDATTYRVAKYVKKEDSFWIKEQSYSLHQMMNGNPIADQFVGGTVYQGYLGVTSYHRWHSPVTGLVAKILTVPGTICAVQSDSTASTDMLRASQGYAAHVA
ncbi:hypothetical protein EYZ11_011029 [Aspergillus tanneri]|uniref:L-tryptophan decarboxylase PsiD-like domain-containing protein n=1 Tax=Aspergillus tanneri TaxID=1220188 RepID=A0A4S3J3X8_9EURO|nr:uncharacterized protein ATNIH1004_002822 [Aspergillus tanneri]KAA8650141.1 hypothetical protein ATNIH1004_002822 [Aspergillus tanneri]THC89530.1 hypothetical protein EYZ11_011029 [Aspergillus tanneri]